LDKVLVDKSTQPTDALLQSVLGTPFAYFQEILGLTAAYTQEWTYPSKSSGWVMKISRKCKALCWLFPYQQMFRVSFALREHEKDALLDNKQIPASYKELLRGSKKYREGYALRIDVESQQTCNEVQVFIQQLMALRAETA